MGARHGASECAQRALRSLPARALLPVTQVSGLLLRERSCAHGTVPHLKSQNFSIKDVQGKQQVPDPQDTTTRNSVWSGESLSGLPEGEATPLTPTTHPLDPLCVPLNADLGLLPHASPAGHKTAPGPHLSTFPSRAPAANVCHRPHPHEHVSMSSRSGAPSHTRCHLATLTAPGVDGLGGRMGGAGPQRPTATVGEHGGSQAVIASVPGPKGTSHRRSTPLGSPHPVTPEWSPRLSLDNIRVSGAAPTPAWCGTRAGQWGVEAPRLQLCRGRLPCRSQSPRPGGFPG